MKKSYLFLSLFYISTLQTSTCHSKRDYTQKQYYTLHTTNPNQIETVKGVAISLGATYEGPVGELPNYHWISIPMSSLPKRGQDSLIQRFHSQPNHLVDSIQEQTPARRLYKRAPPPYDPVIENASEEYKLNGGPIQLPSLSQEDGYQRIKDLLDIHDPGFDNQWHLINTVDIGYDINVTGVWSQGITGKGVNVAILDDGLEFDHEDLKDNYFAEGSYDFNLHVEEPKPRLEEDTHGTRCAGEIAAAKNDICGIGVAYDAKVAGIRILSGDITEADEAAAINYGYQKNHIYSCSWGPQDSGEVAQAPQGIIMDAIKNGIQHGRNGTGSIFVFASGNGGGNDDNCNFDGYTNSIFTITVGAVDKLGNHPYYSEKCAAQLVVTYSSGSGGYIYTTDMGEGNQCSDRHGGTSAAAPLAAGVFALVLSVRPELTWRDMQHLCVQSAVPISLDDDDWAELPSGRMFNHKYGYGSLDAYGIVELAKTFESVRPQTSVEVLSVVDDENEKIDIPDITPTTSGETMDKSKAFKSTLEVTREMLDERGLERLEHVTATVNIEHQRRGDMEILLESPNGVISQLGAPRRNDKSEDGLIDWTFMTVKHWEEDPIGNWTLHVIDGKNPDYTGRFMDWKLTLWGEAVEGFILPESENNDGSNKAPDIGVDEFENPGSERNRSFLDQNENDATESSSSFGLYGLVSVFIIASVASTGFIVKKYMLSTTNITYTRPTEEDAFEFDNLISNEGRDLFGDSSDEGEDDELNRRSSH